jgi:DNA-binding GntR family transcriptional regulator
VAFVLQISSVEAGVYGALRDDIVRLAFAPGRRLGFDELAERYGVSHTPIRQALRRLQGERLVVLAPRRGARVAPLTFDELEEIQAVRLGVEPLLAGYAVRACPPKTFAAMERRLADIDAAMRERHLDHYLEAYREFRDTCYSGAGKPGLHRVVREQRRRAERYLRFLCDDVQALGVSRDHQDSLLQACFTRNSQAAEAATREALWWTLSRLASLLDTKSGANAAS